MTLSYDSIGSIPTEVLGIDGLSFSPFLGGHRVHLYSIPDKEVTACGSQRALNGSINHQIIKQHSHS